MPGSNPKQNESDRLAQLKATLKAMADEKKYNRLKYFMPYEKQAVFLDAGRSYRERLFMAGNQLGKTETGAYEAACHLTGRYPDWWEGRRWDRPTRGWIAGITGLLTRDGPQKKLCGEPGVTEAFGTGYIPKECFVDRPSLGRGVTDAYDTMQIRHQSGGVSVGKFKSYEQGKEKFQSETLDWLWLDEEPPMDIYSECLTRTNATGGMVFITFTPLNGMTDVVSGFINNPGPNKKMVNMTIYEVTHISPEEREIIIASYPAYQRDARIKGIPMLGSGRIFPYLDANIAEPSLSDVPLHWTKLWGMDFGISHPFGAVLTAWDRDADVIHILHAYRAADQRAVDHAVAMKHVGAAVPVAWPHDGDSREKSSGEELIMSYRKEGLLCLPTHATFPEGGYSTEAGIMEMQDRMNTGRLKVAAHLAEWFEEYGLYHRKDGLIVKERDDLMSATRIAVMAKRFGRPVALGGQYNKNARRGERREARDVDFNVFD